MDSKEESYLELLRVSSLAAGIYTLGAGETDKQGPHAEDEIYYVISGKADFEILGPDPQMVEVSTGSILFVPKKLGHRFLNIRDDLTLFVVFAGH